jgi:hypothetical protein
MRIAEMTLQDVLERCEQAGFWRQLCLPIFKRLAKNRNFFVGYLWISKSYEDGFILYAGHRPMIVKLISHGEFSSTLRAITGVSFGRRKMPSLKWFLFKHLAGYCFLEHRWLGNNFGGGFILYAGPRKMTMNASSSDEGKELFTVVIGLPLVYPLTSLPKEPEPFSHETAAVFEMKK